jgi:hypothetical protein
MKKLQIFPTMKLCPLIKMFFFGKMKEETLLEWEEFVEETFNRKIQKQDNL